MMLFHMQQKWNVMAVKEIIYLDPKSRDAQILAALAPAFPDKTISW